MVYLDLPGLDLPDEAISTMTPDIRSSILRARALKEWHEESARILRRERRTGEAGEIAPRPPMGISDYDPILNRKYANDLGPVVGLFGEASKGDIIVIPSQIHKRQVWVGEFVEDANVRRILRIDRYGTDPIQARLVKWLGPIDELRLPLSLSDALRNQNPFSLLARRYHEKIFEEAYGTYYNADHFSSRLVTESADFTSDDNFDFSLINKLISKLCADIDAGSDQEAIGSLSALLFSGAVPPEYQATISCNINSPGLIDLKAGTIVPLILAVMLSLLQAADAAQKPSPKEVSVINSLETGDGECLPEINQKVRAQLERMGYDVWQAACLRAQALKQRTGMTSGSRSQTKQGHN
jgi:hypothetical protein